MGGTPNKAVFGAFSSMSEYDCINVMVPTRCRVKNGRLPRLVNSLVRCTENPENVCLTLFIDVDDVESREYAARLPVPFAYDIMLNTYSGEGPHLSRFYNAMYKGTRFNERETLVSMIGDDMEFLTEGWDSLVLSYANLMDGRCLIYGDDCFRQHENMAVHFFTTRDLVNATCHDFMWEMWRANMIDYVWTRIAQELGVLCYIPSLQIAHHHSSGVDGADATYHGMDQYRVFAAGRENLIKAYVDEAVRNVKRVWGVK